MVAATRSLEAELATEATAETCTALAHQQAVQLHTEAAKWRKQAGDQRRAFHHEAYARVHSRIAARLQSHDEPREEDEQ